MSKRQKLSCILIVCIFAAVGDEALPHPGRTDSSGGHYNHKTGGYHYHNTGRSSSGSASSVDDSDVAIGVVALVAIVALGYWAFSTHDDNNTADEMNQQFQNRIDLNLKPISTKNRFGARFIVLF